MIEEMRVKMIQLMAEEILWKRLASNAEIVRKVADRRLKQECSLTEMRHFLSRLGHHSDDLNDLNVIHITGSKGKGSTAAFVESILRKHGQRTALFTSPHLVHPRERLKINGLSMCLHTFHEKVIEVYERLGLAKEGDRMGLFRFMTLLTFDYLIWLKRCDLIDVAILEVGMGGRYDSTNVIERPIVTAITSLSLEHVTSLGPTLADIALHKVGIAKPNIPMFTVAQPPEALKVIIDQTKMIKAPLNIVDSDFEACLGIEGRHQQLNAALAVRICKEWLQHFNISHNEKVTLDALANACWPGRHQIFLSGQRKWFLDGAHTVESIQFAADWFRSKITEEKENIQLTDQCKVLLFHISHDRSCQSLLQPLLYLNNHQMKVPFQRVIFIRPSMPTDGIQNQQVNLDNHREMASYWRMNAKITNTTCLVSYCSSDEFWRDQQSIIPLDANILVTGSLYLVGDVMKHLNVPIP